MSQKQRLRFSSVMCSLFPMTTCIGFIYTMNMGVYIVPWCDIKSGIHQLTVMLFDIHVRNNIQ